MNKIKHPIKRVLALEERKKPSLPHSDWVEMVF